MLSKRKRQEERSSSCNGDSTSTNNSSSSGDDIRSRSSSIPKTTNSRFVLNVGGTAFHTSRQTLITGSSFFAAALTHFAEGLTDNTEEFFVDRNPKTFPILLDYMRTGVLLCDSDRSMLASLVLEADYYGMDQLLYKVKEQCYVNLHHSKEDMTNESEITKVQKEFPLAQDLVCHKKFPQMYYEEITNKILSSYSVPEKTFVELTTLDDDKKSYLLISEMATVEYIDGQIVTEPMVYSEYARRLPDWRLGGTGNAAGNSTSRTRVVPLSYFLQQTGSFYYHTWKLVTNEVLLGNNGTGFLFTVTNEDGELFTAKPEYIQVLTYSNMTKLTTGYGYNTNNELMVVSEFINFVGMGPKSNY
jgi:hypothetical protein